MLKRYIQLLLIALKSAWNRRFTLFLVICSIAISTALLISIEKIRTQVKENFINSVINTDLIVGTPTSSIQLMLYSIFHIGNATNNISYSTIKELAHKPEIDWVIPISLGDSHKSFPVVATDQNFYKYYQFANHQNLKFNVGNAPQKLFDAVIGAEVAKKLNYQYKQKIHLNHGMVATKYTAHNNVAFEIVGIIAPTGTPIDRSILINLPAMEAIHVNWKAGVPILGLNISQSQLENFNLEPKTITSALLHLKKRTLVFSMQRLINSYDKEPLMAIIPGVAIDELWNVLNQGEQILWIVSLLVTISSFLGLIAVILSGLGQRRRELAILRSVGANPLDIIILLLYEGLIVITIGVILGITTVYAIISLSSQYLAENYGFFIKVSILSSTELIILIGIFIAGFIASLIPAYKAYRISLSDGLNATL